MQVNATNSNVNFKSANLNMATAFVNMNDRELKMYAQLGSYDKKEQQKQRRSIGKILLAIPFVDSIAGGILTKSSLGVKTAVTLNRAAGWGVVIGAVALYNVVKKTMVSKSDTLKTFEQQHPVLSFMGDIGIIMAGFILGAKGLEKLFNKSPEKFVNSFKNGINKAKKIVDKIDNSKFNTKILPKMREFNNSIAKKLPWAADVSKTVLKHSVFTMLGVAIVQTIRNAGNHNKKVEKNYKVLKNEQLKTAQSLVSALKDQRDILAKGQMLMANDLQRALIGDNVVSERELNHILKKTQKWETKHCQA